jgi:hypothetical protein
MSPKVHGIGASAQAEHHTAGASTVAVPVRISIVGWSDQAEHDEGVAAMKLSV